MDAASHSIASTIPKFEAQDRGDGLATARHADDLVWQRQYVLNEVFKTPSQDMGTLLAQMNQHHYGASAEPRQPQHPPPLAPDVQHVMNTTPLIFSHTIAPESNTGSDHALTPGSGYPRHPSNTPLVTPHSLSALEEWRTNYLPSKPSSSRHGTSQTTNPILQAIIARQKTRISSRTDPSSKRYGSTSLQDTSRDPHGSDLSHQEQSDRRYAQQLFEKEASAQSELTLQSKARDKDCAVCGDQLPPLDFPAKQPTDSCMHQVQTCSDCLQRWVSVQLDQNGWDGITCPDLECGSKLGYWDVRKAATEDVSLKYETLTVRAAVAGLEGFDYCLRAGCGSGQISETGDKLMVCGECGYKQCLQCKVAWHEKESCEQYVHRSSEAKSRDEEKASERYISRFAKRCPNVGCGYPIEKNGGCDHMTCKWWWYLVALMHQGRKGKHG